MGNITITFKYDIGDSVANVMSIKEMELMHTYTRETMRPLVLRVEEQMAFNSESGTRIFYVCRTVHGVVEKHPESELVPAENLWDVWCDSMQKRAEKHKA